MTTSNAGHEPRKLVVAALVLALVCRSVGASRFMKRTTGDAMVNAVDMPPPPVPWWKHPSPPPPPPVIDDDDSSPPPPPFVSLTTPPHASRLHQSPPPPPDQDTTVLNKRSHNGRRLFSASDDEQVTESRRCTTRDPATDGALAPGGAPLARIPCGGGGGYAPFGAPYPGVVVTSPVSAPAPAPALSNGADDGPLSHEPASPPSLSGDNSTTAHTTMVSAMKYNQCTYTIITSTGSIEGAGTQADVNVEFFDKHGSSVLFVNLRSQSRNFDRGATDTFTVVGDCVHNICKMHLSHDDSGPSPGWFVNTVTVSLLYQTHVFNVFEWLAKEEPPYSLSRVVSSCPA